jgi:subtilisin family serine protease
VSILLASCSSTTTYSCDNSTTLATESGTSFSAPMVSGVASLLFATSSAVNNVYVDAILQNSARSFVTNSTCIDNCGSGMLDAAAALSLVRNFSAPAKQIEISKDSGGAVLPGFWLGLGLLVWFTRRRKRARTVALNQQAN